MTTEIIEQIKTDALKEFELLSKVYRPSFKTRKIADYLKQRVKELRPDVEVFEDQYRSSLVDDANNANESSGNIWFDLPANAPALANNSPIILQAHMDMVCTFANEEAHARMRELGVELEYHPNGTLTSMRNQTSLGADNGIGIGIMLAIFKNDDFKHGPIRFLVTTDEEVGMCGAAYLGLTKSGDKGLPVKGYKYLLNNDSPFDGEIIASTAGAVVSLFTIPMEPDPEPIDNKCHVYTLNVSGLLGGHDGTEIPTHASAIVLATQILKDINTTPDFRLIEFTSPDCEMHNVIHSQAIVKFATSRPFGDLKSIIQTHEGLFKHKYPVETELQIQISETQVEPTVVIKPYSHDVSTNIISLINSLPYGVTSWKNKATGWIETSGNVGPIYLKYEEIKEDGKTLWTNPTLEFKAHVRSINNQHLQDSIDNNKKLAKEKLGDDGLDYFQLLNLIYGWPGDEDKTFLLTAKKAFEEKGVKCTPSAPHVGLEVSWFKHFNPELNIVSIGPEIHWYHDCKETLYTGTLESVIFANLTCIEKMRFIDKKFE